MDFSQFIEKMITIEQAKKSPYWEYAEGSPLNDCAFYRKKGYGKIYFDIKDRTLYHMVMVIMFDRPFSGFEFSIRKKEYAKI
jgi:hypothetical protein